MNRISKQVDDIIKYVKEKYGTIPEYLWKKTPNYFVLRHQNTLKWYAIVMEISKSFLGLNSDEKIYVINVKCDPVMVGFLIDNKTIFPAYHMNKKHWITVILDGSMPIKEILSLIDSSWNMTKK